MPGEIREINVNQLVNYYENPRHVIGSSEEDTLEKLFKAVGIQYMLNLAEDVQKNGLLGNQQIVVVYAESIQKYIVYEGNRRVAAIKLLINPDGFDFLDNATIERAKKLGQKVKPLDKINCYITDEQEAFFIMERLHSGEDKGRGTKQWTSREKEVFKVRQNHEKNLSYLIDFYVKKNFDGLDITTILPFTTIQRIFNNREIRKLIGLDISDESTFTLVRLQLVIDASKWIVTEAETSGVAVTRLFNKARAIEDKLIPWIQEYTRGKGIEDSQTSEQDKQEQPLAQIDSNGTGEGADGNGANMPDSGTGDSSDRENNGTIGNANVRETATRSGKSGNLPYFFQGLNSNFLDPSDANSHGVAAVCKELQMFSDKRLVATYPIAATFLVRAIIEQAIIYYSKKHCIQGQTKLIWESIKNTGKLNKIIENYKRNLPNYIPDTSMRQYFKSLFENYEDNVDPLNWVIHRPAEFQLDVNTLIELPRKGLLSLINFMLL